MLVGHTPADSPKLRYVTNSIISRAGHQRSTGSIPYTSTRPDDHRDPGAGERDYWPTINTTNALFFPARKQ